MRVGSLFSGYGGLDMAVGRGIARWRHNDNEICLLQMGQM